MTERSTYRAIWFNIAFVFVLFGFIECFSWVSSKKVEDLRFEGDYKKGYHSTDEILGYAPIKTKTVSSIKYKGDELLYQVRYTIGNNGLRISPPSESVNSDQCILFFGDSFTFGEGVEDYEAMPYLVGKLSKVKTHNFGFHGYGPHQMLSALEHGVVDRIVDCKPTVAIYQALVEHIARSAGLSTWDKHGPKYSLSNGTLKYDGHFDDHSSMDRGDIISRVRVRAQAQIDKSFFYRKYFTNSRYSIHDRDVELFIEIINASRNKFMNSYPGSAFHVILWDASSDSPNHRYSKMVQEGLQKKGISLHIISNILPNLSERRSAYQISPYDQHPNALAHTYIAQYVAKTILGRSPHRTHYQ